MIRTLNVNCEYVKILKAVINNEKSKDLQKCNNLQKLKEIAPVFDNDQQQDACEFMEALIQILKNNKPNFHLTCTIYTDEVHVCQLCNDKTTIDNPIEYILRLPVGDDNTDIQTLIQNHYKPQDSDSHCYCSGPKKIIKEVKKPPKVFFIQLERYENVLGKEKNTAFEALGQDIVGLSH